MNYFICLLYFTKKKNNKNKRYFVLYLKLQEKRGIQNLPFVFSDCTAGLKLDLWFLLACVDTYSSYGFDIALDFISKYVSKFSNGTTDLHTGFSGSYRNEYLVYMSFYQDLNSSSLDLAISAAIKPHSKNNFCRPKYIEQSSNVTLKLLQFSVKEKFLSKLK